MNKNIFFLPLLLFILIFFSAEKLWAKTSPYQGPIYNIFFHPLIAYPAIAFNKTNAKLAYIDQWFITVDEFNKILPELYNRGFILVSPKDLFTQKKNANGQLILTRKKIVLPEGKKPLILSLDDYNYYKNMKLNGTVHRFWVDKQGKLVTITHKNKSKPIIRDDQEIPQLLEKFIIQHPNFSFNHARGIISLTGYNGIFGYNTHQISNKMYSSELADAKKVVQKLKNMGWEFSSHSYFHLGEDKQTEQAFEDSEKRWVREVGSIVGPTSYYTFPFGDSWNKDVTRMNFLKSMGYRYFFGVRGGTRINIETDAVVMERFPIDGNALRGKYGNVKKFLNADILDPLRSQGSKL